MGITKTFPLQNLGSLTYEYIKVMLLGTNLCKQKGKQHNNLRILAN